MSVPMDKPCTACAVGWMRVEMASDTLQRLWWVWLCGACGHSEKAPA